MILSNKCGTRRKQFAQIKKAECSECRLGLIWNNKPITLQIDHIDGNRFNHNEENLRWLCPNCHSQTHTFCAKNRGKSPVRLRVIKFFKDMSETDRNKYLSTYTYLEICEELKIHSITLSKVLRDLNIKKPIVQAKLRYKFDTNTNEFITQAYRPTKLPPDLTKEQLTTLIMQKSMVKVGKDFGVSDNAVRDWCRKLNVNLNLGWGKRPENLGQGRNDNSNG